MPGQDVLIIFVKDAQPGLVKTRLAGVLGGERSAALYRALADRVREQTAPGPDGYRRLFFFAPAEAAEAMSRWLVGETLVPQTPGDLGARMEAAFRWAFAEGAARVVLIGTDTPDLAHEDVSAAHAALAAHDAVLGPSLDGGYYLVGLRGAQPRLFDGIAWSTPAVLGQTLARAEELDLKVATLRFLGDVDTIDDLRRDWTRISAWLEPALRDEVAVLVRGRE